VNGGPEQGESVGLSFSRELTRKGLHLISATIPVLYAAGLSRRTLLVVLTSGLVAALVVEVARWRSSRARAVFDVGVGALLRDHEVNGVSGATWLIIALLIAVSFFPRDVAVAAMCAVSLGDAAAAVVGRGLRRSSSSQRKSVAGSAACFTVTVVAARMIANLAWREAILAGVLASAAEWPRRPLDDNIRIALAVGCGILLWRMGFS
jgi:dolichol kinase